MDECKPLVSTCTASPAAGRRYHFVQQGLYSSDAVSILSWEGALPRRAAGSGSARGIVAPAGGAASIPNSLPRSSTVETWEQGLTLVHFSAQLEPCVTHKNTLHTLNIP